MRVSGGGTDSFHGLEYFGLITLGHESFEYFLRFFQRACGVCAFLASSVSLGVATPPLLPTLTGYCHRVPVLLLPWWRRLTGYPSLLFSGLLLLQLACRGSLGSAPCVRVLKFGLCLLFGRQYHHPACFPLPKGG